MSVLTDAVRDLAASVTKAPLIAAELEARARDAARDGYPTGAGTRGGSTATPTEGAALGNLAHPLGDAAESYVDDLVYVARILSEAEDRAAAVGVHVDIVAGVPRVRRPVRKVPTPTDAQWCRVHVAHAMFEPVHRGQLCRFCYEWDRDAETPEVVAIKTLVGSAPPRAVLEAKSRGPVSQRRLGEIRAGLQRERVALKRRRKRGRKK